MSTKKKLKHIATGALYGVTGKRVGTRLFYSDEEIQTYIKDAVNRGDPIHIRMGKLLDNKAFQDE